MRQANRPLMLTVAAGPCFFFLLVTAGCCMTAPPVPDMVRLPGHTLGSPAATIDYFKAALADSSEQAVRHQYLCFSDALRQEIQRKHGRAFTLETYMQVRDDVRAYVTQRVGGDIAEAAAGPAETLRPGIVRVVLELGGRSMSIQLIEETLFSIWWSDPLLGRTDGTLPFGMEAATVRSNEVLLRLPGATPQDGTVPQVYRVTYEKAWRILGVEGSDLATDVERFVQERSTQRDALKH